MTSSLTTRDLALVGAGYWGQNLARNFQALGALHTLCDTSLGTLSRYGEDYAGVQKTTRFDTVLGDAGLSKVAIAVPAPLHYRLAKASLEAGKDVYVEKPICLNLQEAEELVALAATRGRILMVGHLLQYHPCIQALEAMVAKGELGKLYYITSNRLNLGKIRREENALWSFAPHDISVILALAGLRLPERVRCIGGEYLNQGVADTTLTVLHFANQVRAHIYVSWLNPFKEQKLTVVGSNGMVVFDDTRPWPAKLILHRHYLTWANGQIPTPNKSKGEAITVTEAEPLREECIHFLRCCGERCTPRTDGQEGLRVLKILEAAQRSLEYDGEAVVPASELALAAVAPDVRPPAAGVQPEAFGPPSAGSSVPASRYYAHPTAVVDDGAQIGEGTKVWHFAHICAGAKIGQKCIFGQNTFVAPDVVIGSNVKVQNNVAIYSGTVIEDDVFLGPSCVLTNVTNPRSQVNRHTLYEKTVIKRGATVGANATIVCGVTLGRYCFIGAGAVVTEDIPDYALMIGVPARQRGWMSRHGHILRPGADGTLCCPESGFHYREEEPDLLRCLDLDEEAALPEEASVGRKRYRDLKAT